MESKALTRRAAITAAVASPLPLAAAGTKEPPAVWPPKGKNPLTNKNQFVLLDLEVRFTPNSPADKPAPGLSVKLPPTTGPDAHINHPNDGFKIVWIDKSIYPDDLPDGWYQPYTSVPPDIPSSWHAPVNFYGGDIHYRVNVIEKPNSKTLTSLISRVTTTTHEGTHNVWFGHGVVTFDGAGVHRFVQPVKAFRPFIRNTKFSFDHRIDELQLCVADSRGAVVHRWVEQAHNAYEGNPNLALYLPLRVRYTAVVVASGAQFEKPSWW